MTRRNLFGTAFFVACSTILIVSFGTRGYAQVATPSPEELACKVAPRDAAFFEAIQGTSVAPDANRGPLIEAYLSSRQAATAEQVAALQETVDQVIACGNAGDFARVSALFTDGYWQREVGGQPNRARGFVSMTKARPSPVPEEGRAGPATVVDARVLPDGRLVALVQYQTADPTDNGTDLAVFAEVGDLWFVDEAITDVDQELGTPVPGE